MPPERILDTRTTNGRLSGQAVHTLDLSGKVPADATAVSVNIAVDNPATAGFLTAWPCDAPRPTTSSLNVTARAARGAHALVALDDARQLCIFGSTATEVIVDLQGIFSPSSVDRFDPRDTRPTRRHAPDRPRAGRTRTGARRRDGGVAQHHRDRRRSVPGYLTAFPCDGALPTVASVNFRAGETVGGAAFVPIGATGEVCVFSNTPTDVVVDLTGSFSPTGALRFVPGVPGRMFDTRDGSGGWTGRLGQGQIIELPAAPDGAEAVSGTLTMVDPALDAHLTSFPCAGALPPTASLNARPRRHRRQLGHGRRLTAAVRAGGGQHPRGVRHDRLVDAVNRSLCAGRSWRPMAAALLGPLLALPAAASAAPTPNADQLPGVYMVTDSVGLGAKDAVPAAFPAALSSSTATRRFSSRCSRIASCVRASRRTRNCSPTGSPSSPAATTIPTGIPPGSTGRSTR